MFLIGQEVEERGSSFHICVGIPQDLVHRLAGAGLGGEMNDGMNILQGGAPYAAIAHVSAEYLHTSIVQKGRPLPIGESSMYLRAEIIKQKHTALHRDEQPSNFYSNEPQSASNEYLLVLHLTLSQIAALRAYGNCT